MTPEYEVEGNLTDLTPQFTGKDVNRPQILVSLEKMAEGFNQITDLSPLTGLTKLWPLWLHGNLITDLTPLAGLTKLEDLYLFENPIPEDQKAMLKKALPNCKITF